MISVLNSETLDPVDVLWEENNLNGFKEYLEIGFALQRTNRISYGALTDGLETIKNRLISLEAYEWVALVDNKIKDSLEL